MSIDLIDVSHSIRLRGGVRIELRDINIHVEKGDHVALLGKQGSGVDQIVDMICGASIPAHGDVSITSEVSWPIGETSFMQKDRSLATNLRFMARIYEIDEDDYLARVSSVGELSDYWNEPFISVSKQLKNRFAFALGVCLPFDIYIIDSPESQVREFKDAYEKVMEDLRQDAGILIVSSKGEAALQFCKTAFVLDDGKITYYEDVEAAVAHLDRLRDKAAGDEEEDERDGSEDDDAFDII